MTYEHIIFDCDGVLVDSEMVAAEIMAPVLSTLGLSITVKHYLSHYTGKTFKAIFEQFNIDNRVNLEMLIKNVEEKVYSNIKAVEGIENVVKSIDMPKSIVSNSALSQIKHAVDTIGLSENFANHFSSSQVGKPKPSPDVYLFAATKLNLSHDKFLVVEDSISGCTAALEANMTVIGFCGGAHITNTHTDSLKKLGVHHIAKNSKELEKLIFLLTKKAS